MCVPWAAQSSVSIEQNSVLRSEDKICTSSSAEDCQVDRDLNNLWELTRLFYFTGKKMGLNVINLAICQIKLISI